MTDWGKCHTALWTKLYPQKVKSQAFDSQAGETPGKKKSLRDYINEKLKAKGKNPR
jgi:hypothetical protein